MKTHFCVILSQVHCICDVIICLPLRNGCHDECPEPGSADSNSGGEGSLLLEVHGHADDGRQVDQSESNSYSSEEENIFSYFNNLTQWLSTVVLRHNRMLRPDVANCHISFILILLNQLGLPLNVSITK